MDLIVKFKRDNQLPEDPKEADSIRKRSEWFVWYEGNLYKKSYTHPLLKCITPEDGDYVLREIHQGACGSHQGARAVAGKALRAGLYWPSLREDAAQLVQKCEKCQKFANVQRLP